MRDGITAVDNAEVYQRGPLAVPANSKEDGLKAQIRGLSTLEDPIRQQLGVTRYHKELLVDKALRWTIQQIVEHRLAGLRHRTPEPMHT